MKRAYRGSRLCWGTDESPHFGNFASLLGRPALGCAVPMRKVNRDLSLETEALSQRGGVGVIRNSLCVVVPKLVSAKGLRFVHDEEWAV